MKTNLLTLIKPKAFYRFKIFGIMILGANNRGLRSRQGQKYEDAINKKTIVRKNERKYYVAYVRPRSHERKGQVQRQTLSPNLH